LITHNKTWIKFDSFGFKELEKLSKLWFRENIEETDYT
jgi:hypothetical protein